MAKEYQTNQPKGALNTLKNKLNKI